MLNSQKTLDFLLNHEFQQQDTESVALLKFQSVDDDSTIKINFGKIICAFDRSFSKIFFPKTDILTAIDGATEKADGSYQVELVHVYNKELPLTLLFSTKGDRTLLAVDEVKESLILQFKSNGVLDSVILQNVFSTNHQKILYQLDDLVATKIAEITNQYSPF